MNKPIGLFGHWHTGSTCIAKVFAAAGMKTGNKETGFIGVKPGQEHPILSAVCSSAYHFWVRRIYKFDQEEAKKNVEQVLISYKEQARKNRWEFYGIKNNYMALGFCWELFGDLFKKVWPGMQIIISERHPVDICKTTDDAAWSESQVVQSWLDSVKTTKVLVENGAVLFMFPFNKNTLRSLLKSMGLKYNKQVLDIYDRNIIKNISTKDEVNAFNKRYPAVGTAFAELEKLSIG